MKHNCCLTTHAQPKQYAQSKSTVHDLIMVSDLSRQECLSGFQLMLGVPVLQRTVSGYSEAVVFVLNGGIAVVLCHSACFAQILKVGKNCQRNKA